MREVLDRGQITRQDHEGNSWSATWEAWQDRIERRVEVTWDGIRDSCTFTSAQDDSKNRAQLAFMLFDRLLRDTGREPIDE